MIRVLLADDQTMTREGLREILRHPHDIEIVGEASNGREAVERASALEPDVVVMDFAVPAMGGFAATKELRKGKPEIGIVILAMHSQADFAARLLRAGALGYVSKEAASSELIAAIRAAYHGQSYVTKELGRALEVERAVQEPRLSRLTDRELQVLRLLAAGRTNGEIAHELRISVRTVGTHRSHILAKLNLRNNADLTRFAIDNKILNP